MEPYGCCNHTCVTIIRKCAHTFGGQDERAVKTVAVPTNGLASATVQLLSPMVWTSERTQTESCPCLSHTANMQRMLK